jgi:CRISPR system Cascade subunit CasC
MEARFIQIHTLTSYPATLLNRDDAGFAKVLPFGGKVRTRISSQCLKAHWRRFDGSGGLVELELPDSVRSRRTFERFVQKPLIEAGHDAGIVDQVVTEIMKELGAPPGKTPLRSGQVTVLGRPEIEFVRGLAESLVLEGAAPSTKGWLKKRLGKDGMANLSAVPSAGLSAALFGRMVTGDILARSDAAVHVAHAFTVHEQEHETDYFSAVDDLLGGDDDQDAELGSGHIGTADLTTGLFYGYVVVDVPLLVSNLTGCARREWKDQDRALAGEIVARLVRVICTVSPGAKLGSTAPHAYALACLVEAGDAVPRTLANAFAKPVPTRGNLLEDAYRALGGHVNELDAIYGRDGARRFFGVGATEALREQIGAQGPGTLADVAGWCAEQVRG